MFKITREETNGVRWLEANKGEFDFTYDLNKGWVSICHDYVMDRPDLDIPLRTPKGIRWKLTQEEIDLISKEDQEWIHAGFNESEDIARQLFPDGVDAQCEDIARQLFPDALPTGLANDELADIMAMFPKADFGYDVDEHLVIYTGRYLGTREVNDANAD
jgi:hypothetical protein